MGLYQDWTELIQQPQTKAGRERIMADYYDSETRCYEMILEHKRFELAGTAQELSQWLDELPLPFFAGFVDGINTSLDESVDLETLEADTQLKMVIEPERLYVNMIDAKADWLFNLPQWEDVLSPERRHDLAREYRASKTAVSAKVVGRNDPCPCGSGKKYKKCCGMAAG